MLRPGAVDPVDDADDGFDARQLGRFALWAGLAILALLAALAAARSETGLRRINEALNGVPAAAAAQNPQKAPAGPSTAEVDAEVRRLARAIERLAADRDRILDRLAALEQSQDITGSLPNHARPDSAEAQAAAAPAGAFAAAVPPKSADVPGRPSEPATPAPTTETPTASATIAGLPLSQRALNVLDTAQQIAAARRAAESVVTKTQFGIDLGSGADIETLRRLWITVKAQHGALLEGLRPVVAKRETGRPGAVEWRLVAGPLGNAAAAARLCAVLGATGRVCRTVPFDGQQLAQR